MPQVMSALAQDTAQVAQLEEQLFSDPMSEDVLLQCLDRDIFVVLKNGRRVFGYMLAQCVLDEMEILRIAVDPAYRRRGYARRLLSHLREMAKDQGVTCCFLEVRESNLAARNLYQGFGFEMCGRRKGFYRQPDEDAIMMKVQWGVE